MKSESTKSLSPEEVGVELLPCAHCGGKAMPRRTPISNALVPEFDAFWVECGVCEIGTKYHDSARGAAVTWNLRTRAVNSSATQNQDQESVKGRESTVAATVVVPKDNSLRTVQSRLIRLAAALVTADGFLSPFTEDNLSSTPRAVLKVAEYQREKLRLWGIEAREIADSITPPSLPESESSSATQQVEDAAPKEIEESALSLFHALRRAGKLRSAQALSHFMEIYYSDDENLMSDAAIRLEVLAEVSDQEWPAIIGEWKEQQ